MEKGLISELDRLKEIPPWEWPEDAKATLLAALEQGDTEAREAAAYMASALVDEEVAGALLGGCLGDAEGAVAGACAIAMGPTMEEAFVEFGDGAEPDPDGDPEEVAISFETYQRARGTLKQAYEDEARPKLARRQALEAAVRAPQDWQEAAVRAALAEDDPEWRLTAVFCMAFVPGFEAEVLAALDDKDLPIRRAAIMAAGEQELEAAGPSVLALAADDKIDFDLRVVALEALVGINPPGTHDLLSSLEAGDDKDLAEVAEEISGQLAMLADMSAD